MPRIFVETTIQIERLLPDPAKYSDIQTVLQNHQTITSTYVWMEVQRTLGQDYQHLIDLFLHQQPTSIAQLLHCLATVETIYSVRTLKRMLLHVAHLLEIELITSTIKPLEVAYELRRKRRRVLYHEFFDSIDQMIDTTVCDLIQPDYTIPPGGRMSCRRETARCSLHELLNANNSALQRLQADSAAVSMLDTGTQRALSEIMPDSTMAKGERNCWSLGDLIIVLECPPDTALWTTNLRHFEPLCQAFGRQLFQPDAQRNANVTTQNDVDPPHC